MFKTKSFITRMFALVLAALMLFSVVACDDDNDAVSSKSGKDNEEIEEDVKTDVPLISLDFLKNTVSKTNNFDMDSFTVNGGLSLDISKAGINLLSDSDPYSASILSQLDFESIGVDATASRDGAMFGLDGTAIYNGVDIADVKMVVDIYNEMLYISVPTATNQVLALDFDSLGIDDLLYVYEQLEAQTLGNALTEKLSQVDVSLIEKVLNNYILLFADQFEGKSSKATISALDVTQSVTAYTYEVSEEDATEAMLALLEYAKKDKEIKKTFAEIYPVAIEILKMNPDANFYANLLSDSDSNDVWDNYVIPYIDEGISELEYLLEHCGNTTVVLTYYMDGNSFAGFELIDPDGDTMLEFVQATDGSDYAIELLADEETVFEFSGKNKNGIVSGTAYVYTSDYDYDYYNDEYYEYSQTTQFDIDRFNLKSAEKGIVDFEMTIDPSQYDDFGEYSEGMLFRYKVYSDGFEKNSVTLSLLDDGENELTSLTMDMGVKVGNTKITAPTSRLTSNPDEWAMNVVSSSNKIVSNLSKAGVPDEVISMLEQNLGLDG